MHTTPSPPGVRHTPHQTSLPTDRREIRAAFSSLISHGVVPSHAVTCVWNDPGASADRVRADLRVLHGRVDRGLFGTRFNLLPAHERTRFLAVTEGAGYHPHAHLAWRVPAARHGAFEELLSLARGALWRRLAPAGSLAYSRIAGPHDWSDYCVKMLSLDTDNIIISDEYLPAH